MKLDLSKFKKLRADKHTTTLKHEAGHEIKLAHSALSPKMRGQLAEMPGMHNEGGEVEDPTQRHLLPGDKDPNSIERQVVQHAKARMADGGSPEDKLEIEKLPEQPDPNKLDIEKLPDNDALDIQKLPEDNRQPTAAAPAQQAPVVVNVNGAQQPQQSPQVPIPNQGIPNQGIAAQQPQPPQDDIFGTRTALEQTAKGIGEQKAGIKGAAEAASEQGAREAKTLQSGINQEQQIFNNYNKHISDLDMERKAFQQDIQQSHIDPNRVIGNMNTGQKIATGIGLILGGMGAVAGQPNLAQEMLQKTIDRDIEAQRVNIGKKESLLNANMKQFGNLNDAMSMTRMMMTDVLSNKLKMAAAQTTDPMAKARALQEAGKLDADTANNMAQLAARRSLLSGGSGKADPEKVVNLLVPEHQRAEANKELTVAQNMSKSKDLALGNFDRVNNMVLGGALSPHQRDALIQPILAQLVKDSEGRITPQDTKMIESLFPSSLDIGSETRQLKRDQLNKFISEKMNFPILKTYGIDTHGLGRFGEHGETKIQESEPITSK